MADLVVLSDGTFYNLDNMTWGVVQTGGAKLVLKLRANNGDRYHELTGDWLQEFVTAIKARTNPMLAAADWLAENGEDAAAAKLRKAFGNG